MAFKAGWRVWIGSSLALLVLSSLVLVQSALAQTRAPDGSAPPPGSPPVEIKGYVRVIDGDSLEVRVDGKQIGIGIVGLNTPMGNTACGRLSTEALRSLVAGGVRLEDVPGHHSDARGRRLYRVLTLDGRDVATELMRSGLSRTSGRGPNTQALRSLEDQARARGTGCAVRSGSSGDASTDTAATDPTEDSGAAQPSEAGPGEFLRALLGMGAAPESQAQAAIAAPTFPVRAATLPSNFVEEGVAATLSNPTNFTFAPDGRIFIAQKSGIVRVVKNGQLLAAPLIDIRDRVNDYWDRGLLSIAVANDFATSGTLYLYYVYENDAAEYSGPKSSRLTRVTVVGDTAAPATEAILLGTQSIGSCDDPLAGADCLPADSFTHSAGGLRVASDNTLFVAVGDGATPSFVTPQALRAQNPDSLGGKVLRIDPAGHGLPSNPYATGDLNAPRSKVWARGFRNPFRMSISSNNLPYVSDVGWGAWEEVNVVAKAGNYGWPCYEGPDHQSGYEGFATCVALYADGPSAVKGPLQHWATSTGGAAMVGSISQNIQWPSEYRDAIFYGDYVKGFIKYVKVDANGAIAVVNGLPAQPGQLTPNADFPVDLQFGPDGHLYYIAILGGDLRRIRYTGADQPLPCPVGQFFAEYFADRTIETRVPSGTPTLQRCEPAINNTWGEGGPDPSVGDNQFSVRWTGRFEFTAGTYTFTTVSDDGIRLWLDGQLLIDDWEDQGAVTNQTTVPVTDGLHDIRVEYYEYGIEAVAKASWAAQASNAPPIPTIISPSGTIGPKVGDTIAFTGQATDPEDGTIPATQLNWKVSIQHCPTGVCHFHPLIERSGASSSFVVPDHGDESFFEITLIATDSAGGSAQQVLRINPQNVQVTVNTVPTGLAVVYDGTSRTTPFTRTTIAGSTHTLRAASPQGNATFTGWNDGTTASERTIVVGASDVTLAANFLMVNGPPSIASLSINNGAAATLSTSATLAVSAVDGGAGLTEISFSNEGGAWSAWQPYSPSATWTLSTGTGTKTVNARVRDALGNVSATASDTITLDPAGALSLTKAGNGGGTITSSDGQITCGATCAYAYTSGTVVTLTAAPEAGSAFAGWGGACSGTSACQITLDAAKSVTATFRRQNVGVVVGPPTGVLPNGNRYLNATLTARSGCGAIVSIQFGEAGAAFANAKVTIKSPIGGPANQTSAFTYTPPPGTTAVSLTIERIVQSGSATVSPIAFVDGCGSWKTFVGGGPDAFR